MMPRGATPSEVAAMTEEGVVPWVAACLRAVHAPRCFLARAPLLIPARARLPRPCRRPAPQSGSGMQISS